MRAPSPDEVHAILARAVDLADRLFEGREPRSLDEDEQTLADVYARSKRSEKHAPEDDDPHADSEGDRSVQLSTRRKARIDPWDLDAEVAVHEHDRERLEQL